MLLFLATTQNNIVTRNWIFTIYNNLWSNSRINWKEWICNKHKLYMKILWVKVPCNVCWTFIFWFLLLFWFFLFISCRPQSSNKNSLPFRNGTRSHNPKWSQFKGNNYGNESNWFFGFYCNDPFTRLLRLQDWKYRCKLH